MESRKPWSSPDPDTGGAYLLHLYVKRKVTLLAGALGSITLPSGVYVYVGSARKSIESRVARHRRLAETKKGKLHWHVDYLLTHPSIELIAFEEFAGYRECDIARIVAAMGSASAPIRRFGASDCRSCCIAHLFRVGKRSKGKMSPDLIQKKNTRGGKPPISSLA